MTVCFPPWSFLHVSKFSCLPFLSLNPLFQHGLHMIGNDSFYKNNIPACSFWRNVHTCIRSSLHMTVATWSCQTIQMKFLMNTFPKITPKYFHLLLEIYEYVRMFNETGILCTNFDIFTCNSGPVHFMMFLWPLVMFQSFPNLDRLGQV